MLIFLALDQKQTRRMNSEDRKLFFNKFFEASRNGNHWFVLPPKFADWANKKDYFSEEMKSHFIHLDKKRYESYDDIVAKNDHLVIRYGNFGARLKGLHRWEVGHKEVINGDYLERCKLLVEGEKSDGEFYRLLLKTKNRKIKNILDPLSYDIIDGNGRNITGKLKKLVENKIITCCICDSDKLSPDDDFKDTTYNATIQKYPSGSFLGHINCTPCHEVENFLPLEIIEKSLIEKQKKFELLDKKNGNNKNKQNIERINHTLHNISIIRNYIQKQKDKEIQELLWLHIDTKMGINDKNIRVINISSNAKTWLCSNYNVNCISELNIPKIDANVIEYFLASSETKKEFHQVLRGDYWEKYFSDWVEKIMWYLCGQSEHIIL